MVKTRVKRCTSVFLVLFVLILVTQPTFAQEDQIKVYYIGADGQMKTALELAKFKIVDDPTLAETWVINGVSPDNPSLKGALEAGIGGLLIILAFGLLISYPVYSFLYGFFGGWDEKTLSEFDRGTKLSNFMKPMTRLFCHSSRIGAKFSLIHGKFPISSFDEARKEAEDLTLERVKLIQSHEENAA